MSPSKLWKGQADVLCSLATIIVRTSAGHLTSFKITHTATKTVEHNGRTDEELGFTKVTEVENGEEYEWKTKGDT